MPVNKLEELLKEFDIKAKAIHPQFGESPETVFHYRKWGHLENIIRKKELRVAFFRHLDEDDITLGHKRILSLIKIRMQNNERHPKIKMGPEKQERKRVTHFWKTLHDKFEKIMDINDTYLLCFAEPKDDKELWKEHGDNGNGISIGFRWKPDPISQGPNPSYIIKVIYEKEVEKFDFIINEFFKLVKESVKAIFIYFIK